MALPTVAYQASAAGTNASIISVVGPKLHGMLITAGWTLEYADADAIGGGSAGNPAWDKAYSSGALAGTVVYRMPANGHTTAWFAKFSLGWGTSSAAQVVPRFVQCGTGHDGSGTLTGGGTGITPTLSTGATGNVGHMLSVSEDGFVACWNGSSATGALLLVERVRAADGTVTDDARTILKPNMSIWYRRFYSAAGGESDERDLVFLSRLADGGAVLSAVTTLADTEGLSTSPIVGPYLVGPALLGAPPRHFLILAASDTGANANVTLTVDGADHTYRTSDNSSMHPAGYVAVAMD